MTNSHRSQFTLEHLSKRRLREEKRRRILLLGFLVLVILGVGYFVFGSGWFFSPDRTVAPVAPVQKNISNEISEENSVLQNEISDLLENEEGEYAVVVKELGEGELVELGEEKKFLSASLYKLWVMAAVFQAIEERSLSRDTYLSGDVTELNEELDIASESAELSEGEVSGTVDGLLKEMITLSGNYPAYLLGRTVGMGNVVGLMEEYGWENSQIGNPPMTTASDVADFFEKLYRGEIVSEEASEEMLEILLGQSINDRIPVGLPEEVEVAHKTGELDGYKHDAGIVYAPFGDYVIVMLSNTPSQARAVEVEAEVSRIVWEYLSSNER